MERRSDPHDLARLTRRRAVTIQDLLVKAENEDWHGVADAAMDLREIDAQVSMAAYHARQTTEAALTGSEPAC